MSFLFYFLLTRILKSLKARDYSQLDALFSASSSYEVTVRDLEYTRALYLVSLEKYDEARKALHKEIEKFPDNEDARSLLKELEEH